VRSGLHRTLFLIIGGCMCRLVVTSDMQARRLVYTGPSSSSSVGAQAHSRSKRRTCAGSYMPPKSWGPCEIVSNWGFDIVPFTLGQFNSTVMWSSLTSSIMFLCGSFGSALKCSPILWSEYALDVGEGLLMWPLFCSVISCTAVLSNQSTTFLQLTQLVS
jgi:hypothetical protein